MGAANIQDSLTQQIFHGDKIYLKNGNMAFKPLGIETVHQPAESDLGKRTTAFDQMQTTAIRHKPHHARALT